MKTPFQVWCIHKDLAKKEPMGMSRGFDDIIDAEAEFSLTVQTYGDSLKIELREYFDKGRYLVHKKH